MKTDVDSTLSDDERRDREKALREERITQFGTLVHKTIEDKLKGNPEDYSSFFKGEKGRNEVIKEA